MRLPALLVLVMTSIAVARAPEAASAWKPLFAGDSLEGWTTVGGANDAWSVKQGVLHCSGGKARRWLASPEQYANFEVELEVKITPGGNSGIFLRTPKTGDPTYHGMEIQILDNDAPNHKGIKEWQYAGSLYHVAAAKPQVNCTPGQWHKFIVTCDRRTVRVVLDGHKVVETNLDDHRDLVGTVPGIENKAGYLGLQNYGNPLEFRNVRIRML